ncbi:MAG: phage tail protein [Flavobacteriaceae bacterium]
MNIYPPVSFYFRVSFNGIGSSTIDTQFQSVAGLSVEMQTETVAEGGENRFEHVLPVRSKYNDLVLKRGLFKDSDLIQWCFDAFESTIIEPVSLDISMLNEEGDPLISWNVVHAWPKKWSVSDLNAESSAIAIESLELHYRYFRISKS